MAKLCVFLVLCFATAALGHAASKSADFLVDGRCNEKLDRIQEFTRHLAGELKKLKVDSTPGCKVKLADIANEMVFQIHVAIYNLNQAIPSIKSNNVRKSMVSIVDSFGDIAHELLEHIHKDPEALKTCFSNSFDKTTLLATKIADVVHSSECKDEHFISNQLRKSISDVTYGGDKVKFGVDFFEKSNEEVKSVIDHELDAFCTVLQACKNDDPKVREELIHMIQQLERIEENAVTKLENYVHINPEDNKNIPIIKEVSKALSNSCDNFHQLTCGDYDVAKLKTEIDKEAKRAINEIKKLAQCDVGENSLGGVYVRSILFDGVTFPHVYERELKRLNAVKA